MFHKVKRKRSFVVALSTISSLLLLLASYQNCGGSLTTLNSTGSTGGSPCEGECLTETRDGDETPSTSGNNVGTRYNDDSLVNPDDSSTPGDNDYASPDNSGAVAPPVDDDTLLTNQWRQVVKRTQAQKTAGLSGGEGCQMIFGIAYAPSHPNIVYFVTDTSQVWKSTDGGTSWQKTKATGFGALGGASIVVHPTNPDIVFVAGGTMLSSVLKVFPDSPMGIFRTTDGGNNWTLVKSANFTRNDSKGGIHIAFAGSNMYAAPSQEGILKSTNGGTTWNLLNKSGGGYVLDTLNIRNIVVHPTNNTILYVSTSNGLYKVEDGSVSATVTKIGTGLPSGTVYQLVIDPNTPNTMYIAAGTNGVWKSTNGGSSFSKILSAPVNSQGKTGAANHIEMSPVNSSKLIVSFHLWGKYVYHTSDGGANWTQTTSMDESNADGYIAGSVFGYTTNLSGVDNASAPISFHPTIQNTALAIGWGNQVKKTTDGGVTWKYSNTGFIGMAGGIVDSSSAIGWDSTNYNRAAFAHADFGTMVTEDNEDTFVVRMGVSHNDRHATSAVAMRGNIIVQAVGTTNNSPTPQAIAISRDSGANWTKEDAYASFKFIAFHPQNNNIVYAGKYKFTNIQTNNTYTTLSKTIAAVFKGDGDTVYSYGGSTVYKSTNAGATWTTPYPSLNLPSGSSVVQIAVSPTDENRIYAAVRGKGIYIINNTAANGGTAMLKNDADGIELDQFEELNVLTVATDPNNADIVYAGTRASWKGQSNGVFRSTDGGNTWSNITNDTFGTMFYVKSISVRPHNSYVYISSYSGTWKLPPPTSTAER